MKIYIKNMVCFGTKSFVIKELEELGFNYNSFESGEIDLGKNLSWTERKKLDQSMQQYGLELNYGGRDLLSVFRNGIHNLAYNHIIRR